MKPWQVKATWAFIGLACRFPGHKNLIACDSKCPDKHAEGVTCIETAGRHDHCMGPNGPAWQHPADCECVEVRRVLENPKRRAITKKSRVGMKPLDAAPFP